MLFNTKSCEVQIDYSRLAGSSANDITIGGSGGGLSLVAKMKDFVRPRCQAILFDNKVNSVSVIALNFYQVQAFCAVKVAKYLNRSHLSIIKNNVKFLSISIQENILFTCNLISSRIKNTNQSGDFFLCKERNKALWLGLHAFISVFGYLRRYRKILSALKSFQKQEDLHSKDTLILQELAKKALEQFDVSKFQLF